MPLEAHVTRVRETIKTFIESAPLDENVLLLRTVPELMQHAARLIRSLEKDSNRLFTAQPGDGDDPEAYFAAWENDIRTQVTSARPRWYERDTERSELLKAIVLPDLDPQLPLVPRYAAWFEMLARELVACRVGVVLIAFIDADLETDTSRALADFGRHLQSARLRLIVVETRSKALCSKDAEREPRVRVGSLVAARHDPRTLFAAFLASPTERVLVVSEGASNLSSLITPHAPKLTMLELNVPYDGAEFTEAALQLELGVLLEAHGLRLRVAHRMRAVGYPARTVERITSSASLLRGPIAEQILVRIDLRPILQPDHAASWVESLARECVDPRVKFVVFDDPALPLAPELARRGMRCVRGVAFSLSADQMARGAAAKLRRSDLPPRERFALLLIAAGFASGKKQFDQALRSAGEAHALAPTTGDPTHPSMAALSLANIQYRSEDFGAVQRVLTPAIERAADAPGAERLLSPMVALLAAAHLRQGTYDDAVALYGLAANLERNQGGLVMALHLELWRGEALRRAGKPDAAREVWLKVVEDAQTIDEQLPAARDGVEAEALERLSMLAREQGDAHAARELHERARRCESAHVHVAHQP